MATVSLRTNGAMFGEQWGLGVSRCLRLELEDEAGEMFGGNCDARLLPIPDSFICPISTGIMVDPVATVDGSIYEREQIEIWIRERRQRRRPVTSPATGLELPSLDLMPLSALQKAIETYLHHRPELRTSIGAGRSYQAAAQVLENDLLEKEAVRSSIEEEMSRLQHRLAEVEKERDAAEVAYASLRDELDQLKKKVQTFEGAEGSGAQGSGGLLLETSAVNERPGSLTPGTALAFVGRRRNLPLMIAVILCSLVVLMLKTDGSSGAGMTGVMESSSFEAACSENHLAAQAAESRISKLVEEIDQLALDVRRTSVVPRTCDGRPPDVRPSDV